MTIKEKLMKLQMRSAATNAVALPVARCGAAAERVYENNMTRIMAECMEDDRPEHVHELTRLLMEKYPEKLFENVQMVLPPMLCMNGTKIRFRNLSGGVSTCSANTILCGASGTGKECMMKLLGDLCPTVIEEDAYWNELEVEYQLLPPKEREKEREPETKVRIIRGGKFSSAKVLTRIHHAEGRHCMVACPEMNEFLNSVKSMCGRDVVEYVKLAMDGDGGMIDRNCLAGCPNYQCKSRLNLLVSGTFYPTMKLIKAHSEDGLVNRCWFTLTKPRQRETPIYRPFTRETEARIEEMMQRLLQEDNSVEKTKEMTSSQWEQESLERALKIPELERLCRDFAGEIFDSIECGLLDRRCEELTQRIPDMMMAFGALLYVIDGKVVTREMLSTVEWCGRKAVRNAFLVAAHMMTDATQAKMQMAENARTFDNGGKEWALRALGGKEFTVDDVMALSEFQSIKRESMYVYLGRWTRRGLIRKVAYGRFVVIEPNT